MKTVFKTLALVGAMAIPGAASAATLNLVGTTTPRVLANNDLGLGLNGTSVNFINGANKTALNGLEIVGTGPFKITYTYLGFEAGNSNYSVILGTTVFTAKGMGASTTGDTATAMQIGSGLIDFAFGTSAPAGSVGLISNNGVAVPASSRYSIGYQKIDSNSYYALFDDIAAGDRDFDDLGVRIDVSAVPLPAGGILLLTAMGGIAALRRRKSV